MNIEMTIAQTAALMNATRNGETIQALDSIQNGADVNATDSHGRTALIIAADEGHTYIAQLLLEYGADATLKDRSGRTALKAAESKSFSRIVALLGASQKNLNDSVSPTQLQKAVEDGNINDVNESLVRGEDVNARAEDGWTPLMLATVRGHIEIVKALLSKAADVEAKNNRGWTALMLAVSMCDIETMQVLLDGGADVNARDNNGKTSLVHAASENNIESLKTLLNYGADVSIGDKSGETALTTAKQRGYQEVTRLIEEAYVKSETSANKLPRTGITAPQNEGMETLFNDAELQRLKEELDEFLPQTWPASAESISTEAQSLASAEQALISSQLSNLGGRLIAAIEALRLSHPLAARLLPAAQHVPVADFAHKIMLTLPEAAALCSLSRNHLRQAIKNGLLNAQIIGRGWRIKRTDLDGYIREL